MTFKNKTILLTGAATNDIGRAAVLIFASLGGRVIIFDLDARAVQKIISEFQGLNYQNCLGMSADISKLENVERALKNIIAREKTIDILVNCFQCGSSMSIEKITKQDWDKVFLYNLKLPFLCCREVAPVMKNKKSGKIINLCSEEGRQGVIGKEDLIYSASMGSIFAFTYSLAFELGPFNINVNAVAHGALETYSLFGSGEADERNINKFVNETDLKHLGSNQDPAYLIAFLASDWGKFITGQVISVNGGLSHN